MPFYVKKIKTISYIVLLNVIQPTISHYVYDMVTEKNVLVNTKYEMFITGQFVG